MPLPAPLRPFVILPLLLLTACNFGPKPAPSAQPPDFAKVTRIAPADLSPVAADWSKGLNHEFVAEADAPIPHFNAEPTTSTSTTTGTLNTTQPAPAVASPLDPGLVDLAARAAARRAALRELATQLLDTSNSLNQSLRTQLTAQPQLLATFNDVLEKKPKLDFTTAADSMHGRAMLNGSVIISALQLDKLMPQPSQQDIAAARERARDAALEQAKSTLREQLLQTKLDDGTTYGEKFKGNTAALNEIDALVFLLQPDEIHYNADNSARVTLYFDRNQIRATARQHENHGWHFPFFGKK